MTFSEGSLVNYDSWINRERRIRLKILSRPPVVAGRAVYRVCQDCGEVCLCHEPACPNCNSVAVTEQEVEDLEAETGRGERIRCRHRFERLM